MKVKDLLWILALGAGGLFAYERLASRGMDAGAEGGRAPTAPRARAVETGARAWVDPPGPVPTVGQAVGEFRCDGRTRCPQMRSCEEAEYFLRHCPGTEMDGDNDGTPCERQWCGEGRQNRW